VLLDHPDLHEDAVITHRDEQRSLPDLGCEAKTRLRQIVLNEQQAAAVPEL
jgi:hypothetical protein